MNELDIKRKASELLQKGRWEEAVAEYEGLLENSKKPNPAIQNLIGDIYVKQGNFEKGFEHYLGAARAYKEEGLFHNGIAVGKKILRLDRDQVDVYGMLADLYARQGLGMDSLKFLREFASRKESADEYPAALAAFAEACELLTNFPDVHTVYGEMLERVDRLDDAAMCYANAAQAYSDKGWSDQAEQLTRRAKAVTAGGTPAPSETKVSDMMNLRSLEDSEVKASAPAVSSASSPGSSFSERGDLELLDGPSDTDDVPWQEYQPGTDAALPPPPPLPPRETASDVTADTAEIAFVEPSGLDATDDTPRVIEGEGEATLELDDANLSLQDALDEMESLTPSAAGDDALHVVPDEGGLVLDGLDLSADTDASDDADDEDDADDAATSAESLNDLRTLGDEPDAAEEATRDEAADVVDGVASAAESLADLPGIVLPNSDEPIMPISVDGPLADDAPSDVPAEPAEPLHEISLDPPNPVPPTADAEAPAAADAPPEEAAPIDLSAWTAPEEEAAPAAAAADGLGDVDPGLNDFFSENSGENDRQHTVVIGDDFELIREGGDVNEVIADFREATLDILDLDDFQAHYDLGTTYMEMELFDEAAAEFELSSRGEDFALASQEMLGYCFLRKGQIDLALRELEKGLAIDGYQDEHKLGLFYNLGIACGVVDREQEAIGHFQRILEIDPEFRDTRSRLERLVQSSA